MNYTHLREKAGSRVCEVQIIVIIIISAFDTYSSPGISSERMTVWLTLASRCQFSCNIHFKVIWHEFIQPTSRRAKMGLRREKERRIFCWKQWNTHSPEREMMHGSASALITRRSRVIIMRRENASMIITIRDEFLERERGREMSFGEDEEEFNFIIILASWNWKMMMMMMGQMRGHKWERERETDQNYYFSTRTVWFGLSPPLSPATSIHSS